MNIIQIYAQTAEKDEHELEELYSNLDQLSTIKDNKKHHIDIIRSDFNANIGQGRVDGHAADYGLDCQNENFMVANTLFSFSSINCLDMHTPSELSTDFILLANHQTSELIGVCKPTDSR